jgi:hypothetical protein
MKWFRLYSEARYDAKLRSLTAPQFRVWFNLLCLASEQPTRGVIDPKSDRVLAFEVAEGDVELLNQTIETLVALHCVTSVTRPVIGVPGDAGTRSITFINFAKRQYSSTDCHARSGAKSSTERVRKYRERKRLQKHVAHGTQETPGVTPEGTPGTPPEDRVQTSEGDTPRPPSGGVCVPVAVFDPRDDEEPFVPPAPTIQALGIAPRPAVANDPAEVARVEAKAERLFPMLWFGAKVQGLAGDYPMAWVELALEETHAAGVRDWRYALGILRRLAREGGPKRPPGVPARAPAPDPELAVHHVSPRRAAEIEATYRPQPSRTLRRPRPCP